MIFQRPPIKILLLLCCSLTFSITVAADEDDSIFNQSLESLMQLETELKAEVGSRSGEKKLLDATTPVDVITSEQIERSGLNGLTDVLRYYIAGFNAPEPSLNDGSDHVRAFSLRGMEPDQVLVLLNGKRMHTSALLHVNGSIGRGSSGVDLDTIALSSIDHVEILRDGAAAQYGSDAIAGVINIILKGMGRKSYVATNGGLRKEGDGAVVHGEAFLTIPMQYDGFINVSMSAERQQQTQRSGKDARLAVPRPVTHFGLPDSSNYRAVINAEVPLRNNMTPYFSALFNKRDSKASAFYRTPNASNLAVYPNGFLPVIHPKITDYNLIAGAKGSLGDDFSWDLSQTLGSNDYHFYVENSMNYALGAASPTSFDNGGSRFIQYTTNLDVHRQFSQWNIAGGLEYRVEDYRLSSGEPASYTASGSQGLAGFSPLDATQGDRNSQAIYADVNFHSGNGTTFEGAVRSERYSDFGSSHNIKLAAATRLGSDWLLRSSASTGFRAPSLSQIHYSNTSTFLDTTTSQFVTAGTFRPDHPVSIALGAKPLKAENSRHLAIGTVYEPNNQLSLMVDYFYTRVNNRIVLSDLFSGATPAQAAILAAYNVKSVSFFTNNISSAKQGVDIRLNAEVIPHDQAKLNLSLWYHYSRTWITGFDDRSFGGINSVKQLDRVLHGQPTNSTWKLLTNYRYGKLNTALNFSHYSGFHQVVGSTPYDFNPMLVTDLDVEYKINNSLKVAVGGNNIFNIYPSRWRGISNTFFGADSIIPTSYYSPSGISGAYYYLRVSVKL